MLVEYTPSTSRSLARLRLARRASFLHERQITREPSSAARLEQAETMLRLWRKGALADEMAFAQRLRDAGVSRADLLSILSEEHEEGDASTYEAPWLSLFADITSARGRGELPAPADPDADKAARQLRFASFVDPFVETGRDRLRSALASDSRRSALRLGPLVEDTLVRSLANSLTFTATRTLVLELNVARMLDQLVGDTPEERFAHFLSHHLGDREIREGLLHEYPVLARLMTTTVERWLSTTLELLRRLADEMSIIERFFVGGARLGDVTAIHMGLSDPHRGGRTVAVLAFGSGLKIVYKPKSLAVDVEFQKLLAWLNTTALRFEQRTIRVLDRRDHGWVEFVEHTSCSSLEAVRNFYFRQGSMLSLLYVLRATDIHFENLIAAGAYPVLVDLETLLHHRSPTARAPSAVERALMVVKESVFFVGLLPVFALERGVASGVDFSALGGLPGQTFPHPTPVLENVDQDTMRFTLKTVTTTGADNRPRLNGEPVSAAPYVEEIIEGFVETYGRLIAERSTLMARLEAFATVQVRHVLRPTSHYTSLLNSALHPDFLRNGMDRELALNRLWANIGSQPILSKVVRFEHADLLAGDVPIFTARPGSRDLWSSQGERLPDFFPQASLDACRERLALMDERNCAEQVKLLRMSLKSLR